MDGRHVLSPTNELLVFLQVIFLCGLFGYLCFLILIKWWMYYATMDPAQVANSEKCAPNLIIVFINMMLFII